MAWMSTVTGAGTIVESKLYITVFLWVIMGTASKWKQTKVVTVTRYAGLTQEAAEAQAATDSEDDECTDAHTEATGGGSYSALSTYETVSDWERVVPEE